MLTKKTPDILDTTLTIVGQGGALKFGVVYHNRTQEQTEEHLRSKGNTLADHVLYLIKSIESEYPLTVDGIKAMENDRPGMCMSLINGFHKARMVELEKN